ncbi:glycosyl transferase [Treponema phagedenis]|nr:glycosyltransferase [Treponema phagedenis]QEK09178.1 glycosyl transferase [Treponema phagedenis]
MEDKEMIPKIIHYCWFGGHPLPPLGEKCIASWKKFCPDYEIKEWNETNYDVHKIPYISQAYDAKKYAFVSDYARFDILYEYGGIYFDTDVEVIRPIDELVHKGAFAGIELPGRIAAGLGLAAKHHDPIYAEILESYRCSNFIKPNGEFDLTTVVTRVTDILKKYGFSDENQIQTVAGITIYPIDFFCPKNYGTEEIIITKNTYSIHHYSASWCSDNLKRLADEKRWILENIKNPYLAWLIRKACIAKARFLDYIQKNRISVY